MTHQTMQEVLPSRAPIAVVESFLANCEAFDVEGALAHLAPEIVYQNYPLPPARGIDAVHRAFHWFMRALDGFEVKMHNIAERDGVVLTERTDILKGPLLYLDLRVNGTFEVRDGKIVYWRDYLDVGELLLKLAASPIRRYLHG